jgi:hypothetical protein
MGALFGISGYRFGPRYFVPPSRYRFGDSGIVGATLSRELYDFSGYAAIDGEIGAGQRVGSMREQELWGAVYLRWKAFPWSHIVRTTLGISVGVNYATGISAYEVRESQVGHGSRALIFLSPEITFGNPDRPNEDFIIRIHHRSGAGQYFGSIPLFKGVWGGAQELVAGYRLRF